MVRSQGAPSLHLGAFKLPALNRQRGCSIAVVAWPAFCVCAFTTPFSIAVGLALSSSLEFSFEAPSTHEGSQLLPGLKLSAKTTQDLRQEINHHFKHPLPHP